LLFPGKAAALQSIPWPALLFSAAPAARPGGSLSADSPEPSGLQAPIRTRIQLSGYMMAYPIPVKGIVPSTRREQAVPSIQRTSAPCMEGRRTKFKPGVERAPLPWLPAGGRRENSVTPPCA
jgi:hypothetical protein